MSRVINTDSPGKRRNQQMRTCAELIRHLSQKDELDGESKDMLAHLVFTLREIDEGINESAQAWEKRNYWMKAEEFRERWRWAGMCADELTGLIFAEEWGAMPAMMLKLFPHFSDIKVNKFTRDKKTWQGAYKRLLVEKPSK